MVLIICVFNCQVTYTIVKGKPPDTWKLFFNYWRGVVMSLPGFDNYSSVRLSLKLLIGSPRMHCRKLLKGHSQVLHLVLLRPRKNKNIHKRSFFPLTCPRRWRKTLNVSILLDLSAVEPVAALINPAVMYYLCESPRDCSRCCRYHSS